jgi:hypothetical protein
MHPVYNIAPSTLCIILPHPPNAALEIRRKVPRQLIAEENSFCLGNLPRQILNGSVFGITDVKRQLPSALPPIIFLPAEKITVGITNVDIRFRTSMDVSERRRTFPDVEGRFRTSKDVSESRWTFPNVDGRLRTSMDD